MHLTYPGLSDHEIFSQVAMFLMAGYETSAITLTFLAYCLARNPEVMKRLQKEIDSTFPNKVDGSLLNNSQHCAPLLKTECLKI